MIIRSRKRGDTPIINCFTFFNFGPILIILIGKRRLNWLSSIRFSCIINTFSYLSISFQQVYIDLRLHCVKYNMGLKIARSYIYTANKLYFIFKWFKYYFNEFILILLFLCIIFFIILLCFCDIFWIRSIWDVLSIVLLWQNLHSIVLRTKSLVQWSFILSACILQNCTYYQENNHHINLYYIILNMFLN